MIIECKECKGKVSDKAAACPHCGNPITPAPLKYDPTKDYSQAENNSPPGTETLGKSGSYFLPSFLVGAIAAGLWAWFGDATVGFGNQSWAHGFFVAAQREFPANEGMAWAAAWIGCAMVAVPAGLITGFIGTLFGRKS